jgi:hypothetical protein
MKRKKDDRPDNHLNENSYGTGMWEIWWDAQKGFACPLFIEGGRRFFIDYNEAKVTADLAATKYPHLRFKVVEASCVPHDAGVLIEAVSLP